MAVIRPFYPVPKMPTLVGQQAPLYSSYEEYNRATPTLTPQVLMTPQPLQQEAMSRVQQSIQPETLPSMPLTRTISPTFFQQYGTRLKKKDLEKTAFQKLLIQQLGYSPLLSARMAGYSPHSIY